jgi:hypothetical protein
MATVRFSQELKDAIIGNAKTSFASQVHAAQIFEPKSVTGDQIYYAVFGDFVPIMEQLPEAFFDMATEVRIRQIQGVAIDKMFAFSGPRRWPHSIGRLHPILRPSESYGGGYIATNHPFWQDLQLETKAWNDKRLAAIKRRDEFVASVKQVIEAHITLAPALKMWPPLWDLVPENYRNRHRQVTERNKSEVEVNVDFNRLTALATQAKLSR